MSEARRLAESEAYDAPWRHWGPYVSSRQWGTVREDYSADGNAWDYFGFDQSHQRAYRWGEDGLAGICDLEGYLNLGLAVWNTHDDRLKERLFGLTNAQGNHGEDVKEYWWAVDATPTHSWSQWLYRYPQAAYPYEELLRVNNERGYLDPEYELADTGVLADNRFFDITVVHAKASPSDILMEVRATNHGPDPAPLHLVPHLWFRNTWSWDHGLHKPSIRVIDESPTAVVLMADHEELGEVRLTAYADHRGQLPRVLMCDNETNERAVFGSAGGSPYPKDGVNRAIVSGDESGLNPGRRGTKAGLQWAFDEIAPGATVTVRLRLTHADAEPDPISDFGDVMRLRQREADDFYASVLPSGTSAVDAEIARRAFAGLQWGKQLYLYDVPRWLDGDPAMPAPPPGRTRNQDWRHLSLADVISMPDEWEYPWFAAWDLAFHCVALAHVDPAFAKHQLLLMCREWAMHPNGQLPAYEWNFGDVNPPAHVWAAWQVYAIDGRRDRTFLQRITLKLMLNFPWWVNRKDADGSHLFEGGFMGLDNVGLFDRSHPLPNGQRLEQADATAWMAIFCLRMCRMSVELAREDRAWDEVATKFLVHFLAIADSMDSFGTDKISLWDEDLGFFHDIVLDADGVSHTMPVRSMVGLIPLAAISVTPEWVGDELPDLTRFLQGWIDRRPEFADELLQNSEHGAGLRTFSAATAHQWERIMALVLNEDEFLSPYGIRSLSAAHRDPVRVQLDGADLSLSYLPGESDNGMFGGNSNWRGPIWMPVNALLTDGIRKYGYGAGADLRVAFPGIAEKVSLGDAARLIEDRLISLFRPGPDGRRPSTPVHHPSGPLWDAHPTFSEYFHGDTGVGLGASHQTGWTALVAHFICAPEGVLPPAPEPTAR